MENGKAARLRKERSDRERAAYPGAADPFSMIYE